MSKDKQPKKSGATRAEEASDKLMSYLFGDAPPEDAEVEVPVASSVGDASRTEGDFDPYVVWVDVDLCEDNPYQPRNVIFKQPLEGLIASINENGQIQAATARPHPTKQGRYQLGVGHRRKNAVKQGANAGIKLRNPHQYIGKIRIEVSQKDDEQMLTEAYAENEDREPLSVFDRATYYTMLRELETRRLKGIGLTPVSSETARKRAGAAVTADGLISWEELVAIRKKEGKPLPGARTLRRIVDVLDISEKMRDKLAAINLADPEDEKADFKGITEKHCSAVRLLAGQETKQWQLIDMIERERLSANEAGERARALRDGVPLVQSEEPTAGSESSQGTDVKSSSSGTAPTAPGTESQSKKTPRGNQMKDLVEAYISPAAHGLAQASQLWPKLKVGRDYAERVLSELDQLDARSAQLRRQLQGDVPDVKKE